MSVKQGGNVSLRFKRIATELRLGGVKALSVQIFGAGMAGSYLYMLLSRDFDVSIKDVRVRPDCRCAWGITYKQAKKLYREIGIDLDEYVLLKPKYAVANGIKIKNRNIVIFDKKRLLEDLWEQIEFKEVKANLYVDATGYKRVLLPKLDDRLYPTIQMIEEHDAEENIYAYARRTGYAWAFPLGNNRWHIGAGDLNETRALELIERLRQEYGFNEGDKICSCKSKIRILPPSKCRPFVSGNVVGVGEAIGCVSGFGEGNAPALESAKILYECLINDELREYEKRILKEFKWIEEEHKFVEAVQNCKKFATLLQLPRVITIEKRRSAEYSIKDLVYLIKTLKP